MIKALVDGAPVDNNPELDRSIVYYKAAKYFGWLPYDTDKVEVSLLMDLFTFEERVKQKEFEDSKHG